jgi:hypothetical protein
MGLELKRGFEVFFSKKLKQIIIHPLPMFSTLFLYIWHWKNICSLLITHLMTQKSLNLTKNIGKYWKMFDDKYMFNVGISTLPTWPFQTLSCATTLTVYTIKINKVKHMKTCTQIKKYSFTNYKNLSSN